MGLLLFEDLIPDAIRVELDVKFVLLASNLSLMCLPIFLLLGRSSFSLLSVLLALFRDLDLTPFVEYCRVDVVPVAPMPSYFCEDVVSSANTDVRGVLTFLAALLLAIRLRNLG